MKIGIYSQLSYSIEICMKNLSFSLVTTLPPPPDPLGAF